MLKMQLIESIVVNKSALNSSQLALFTRFHVSCIYPTHFSLTCLKEQTEEYEIFKHIVATLKPTTKCVSTGSQDKCIH